MSEKSTELLINARLVVELTCAGCGSDLEFIRAEVGEIGRERDLVKIVPCSHCLNRAIADLVEAGEIKIEGGKIRRTK